MSKKYKPTTWIDGQTPVNAKNLNNIEKGIVNSYESSSININGVEITTDEENLEKNINFEINKNEKEIKVEDNTVFLPDSEKITNDVINDKLEYNITPENLNTLKKIANALNNDSNFATTIENQKLDKQHYWLGVADTKLQYRFNTSDNYFNFKAGNPYEGYDITRIQYDASSSSLMFQNLTKITNRAIDWKASAVYSLTDTTPFGEITLGSNALRLWHEHQINIGGYDNNYTCSLLQIKDVLDVKIRVQDTFYTSVDETYEIGIGSENRNDIIAKIGMYMNGTENYDGSVIEIGGTSKGEYGTKLDHLVFDRINNVVFDVNVIDIQDNCIARYHDSEILSKNDIGAYNGVCPLTNGKVPTSYLPSYVDDVLEYPSGEDFPTTGEKGKIYVSLGTNKTFRWSGTQYIEISKSLGLGETSSTAYPGNKGKQNADEIEVLKSTKLDILPPKPSSHALYGHELNNTKTILFNLKVDASKWSVMYRNAEGKSQVATASENDYELTIANIAYVTNAISTTVNPINTLASEANGKATAAFDGLYTPFEFNYTINNWEIIDNIIEMFEPQLNKSETMNLDGMVKAAYINTKNIENLSNALLGVVNTNSTTIKTHNNRLDALSNNISTNTGNITNHETQLQNLSKSVSDLNGEIQRVEGTMESRYNATNQADIQRLYNDERPTNPVKGQIFCLINSETNEQTYYQYTGSKWVEVYPNLSETVDNLINNKLDKTGGTITGSEITINSGLPSANGTRIPAGQMIIGKNGIAMSNPKTNLDAAWIRVLGTNQDDTILEIATGDDADSAIKANEEIVFRQYNIYNVIIRELKLFDREGNTIIPGDLTVNDINLRADHDIWRNSTGVFATLDELNKSMPTEIQKVDDTHITLAHDGVRLTGQIDLPIASINGESILQDKDIQVVKLLPPLENSTGVYVHRTKTKEPSLLMATPGAVKNTIMQRNENGKSQINTPSDTDDPKTIANKEYVTNAINEVKDTLSPEIVEITGVPSTATSGTFTTEQVQMLQNKEFVYIMFNHEKYYLMDKGHTEGYLTYTHVGFENNETKIKCITINLNNNSWILNIINVMDILTPLPSTPTLYGHQANDTNPILFKLRVDATPWSVMYRNASGKSQVVTPTETDTGNNIANKEYVNKSIEKNKNVIIYDGVPTFASGESKDNFSLAIPAEVDITTFKELRVYFTSDVFPEGDYAQQEFTFDVDTTNKLGEMQQYGTLMYNNKLGNSYSVELSVALNLDTKKILFYKIASTANDWTIENIKIIGVY